MVIRKIKRGKYKGYYGVYHCEHGTGLIKAFPTKKQALKMHRAIILSKLRRKNQMGRKKRKKRRKRR